MVVSCEIRENPGARCDKEDLLFSNYECFTLFSIKTPILIEHLYKTHNCVLMII